MGGSRPPPAFPPLARAVPVEVADGRVRLGPFRLPLTERRWGDRHSATWGGIEPFVLAYLGGMLTVIGVACIRAQPDALIARVPGVRWFALAAGVGVLGLALGSLIRVYGTRVEFVFEPASGTVTLVKRLCGWTRRRTYARDEIEGIAVASLSAPMSSGHGGRMVSVSKLFVVLRTTDGRGLGVDASGDRRAALEFARAVAAATGVKFLG